MEYRSCVEQALGVWHLPSLSFDGLEGLGFRVQGCSLCFTMFFCFSGFGFRASGLALSFRACNLFLFLFSGSRVSGLGFKV